MFYRLFRFGINKDCVKLRFLLIKRNPMINFFINSLGGIQILWNVFKINSEF